MQWNADGLNPKIDELREFVRKQKIHVVLVQETKLLEETKFRKSPTPEIKGFTPKRGDRPFATHPGGGLLTYIRNGIRRVQWRFSR
jgi:exonuclease III